MEEAAVFLLRGGYWWIVLVHGLLLLAFLALDPDTIFPRRHLPAGRTLALLALVVAAGAYLRCAAPAAPAVYYDEFYHCSAAESLRLTHAAAPFVREGLPPRAVSLGALVPPYPPGWPCLLSLTAAGAAHPYQAAVTVNRILSIFSMVLVFLVVRRIAGDRAGLCAAFLLSFHPAAWKSAGNADPSGPSLFFLLLALACLVRVEQARSLRSLAAFGLAAAFFLHLRPENFLTVAALAVPAYALLKPFKGRAVLAGVAPFALFALPDVIILAGAALSPHGGGNFIAVPRPGFASAAEAFVGNTANNVLALLENRMHPALLTVLFCIGLASKKSRAFTGKALAAWLLLLLLALAPFPFWDFSMRHTLDGWRFSLNLAFPLILSASYALDGLLAKRRFLLVASLLAVTAANPLVFRPFTAARNPGAAVLDAAPRSVVGASPVAVEDPNVYMALTYYCGLTCFLPSQSRTYDIPADGALFLLAWKKPHAELWPAMQWREVRREGSWRLYVLRR